MRRRTEEPGFIALVIVTIAFSYLITAILFWLAATG